MTAPTASGLQFEPGLPLREVERHHILGTVQLARGDRTEAAKMLGISVRCLQYKLKAYAAIDAGVGADADPSRESRRARPCIARRLPLRVPSPMCVVPVTMDSM